MNFKGLFFCDFVGMWCLRVECGDEDWVSDDDDDVDDDDDEIFFYYKWLFGLGLKC